ncbi:MAG: hypothetical protein HYW70_02795 [Candidatus Nealsonbacteria bacterium]|nr:hypothetical protein [Candidatus Nealsonbacteria bacterium]
MNVENYGYPKGYKVKNITEQTNILRQLFPGIGYADDKLAERPLPPNADGRFSSAPLFSFYDGRVGFGADWANIVLGHYGSASGFVSPSSV